MIKFGSLVLMALVDLEFLPVVVLAHFHSLCYWSWFQWFLCSHVGSSGFDGSG